MFAGAALFASALALWLITRRQPQAEPHRIQGERLAPYYEVVSEAVGCESPSSQEAQGVFIGIHQGFPLGPVLVECAAPPLCQSVSERDPELGQPAIFSGDVADVNWAQWASPPDVLLDASGDWVGSQRRSWRHENECHAIERREVFALEDGHLTQSVEVLYGSRPCAPGQEPVLRCVFRRVRELRAPTR